MNYHAGRLVDHDQRIVFMHDSQRQRLRDKRNDAWIDKRRNGDPLAAE